MTDGKDGFFFTPHDVESATAKISLLMEDSELCRKLGRQAREGGSDRSVASVVEGIVRWYVKGIARKKNTFTGVSILRLILLLLITPLTIFIMTIYDIVVS